MVDKDTEVFEAIFANSDKVTKSSRMREYLETVFKKTKKHYLENIEVDGLRVDIIITKKSKSRFAFTVIEYSLDDDSSSEVLYKKTVNSLTDVVIVTASFLQMRYDKRTNTFSDKVGTAEIEFLECFLPEGTLDYMKCSICLDYYINGECIFSCSHTMCRPCQQRVTRNRMPCPLCRCDQRSSAMDRDDYDAEDATETTESEYEEEETVDNENTEFDDFESHRHLLLEYTAGMAPEDRNALLTTFITDILSENEGAEEESDDTEDEEANDAVAPEGRGEENEEVADSANVSEE